MNFFEILLLVLFLVYFPALPGIFKRAGYPAWHGVVPILQWVTWLRMLKRPWYWIFALFVPGINLLMLTILNVETAIAFNKRSVKEQWYFGALPWVAILDLSFRMKDASFVGPRDWEKRKKSMLREWGEAILFAVIAASIIRSFFFEAFTIPTGSMEGSMLVGDYLFVSKMSYGPKLQQTPLSVPFVHNALPGSLQPSYLEWWEIPYTRLPGFGEVERYDPVVFNFPHGDSVLLHPMLVGHDFYARIRDTGVQLAKSVDEYEKNPQEYNERARKFYEKNPRGAVSIVARPVDKAENYIKRCMGVAGETLEIRDRVVHINGEPVDNPENVQFDYIMVLKNPANIKKVRDKLGLTDQDFARNPQTGELLLSQISLTEAERETLRAMDVVDTLYLDDQSPLRGTLSIFPNTNQAPYDTWGPDNYGPVFIPEKGATVELTTANLPLYERAIRTYEGKALRVDGEDIYIDGQKSETYTFTQDYFWMMGDNRHNSADSRFWGFVPETHVVGKAVFTWFSKENEAQHGSSGIRWDRMFRVVD